MLASLPWWAGSRIDETRRGLLPRRVLTRWRPGQHRPDAVYLTNLGGDGVAELADLVTCQTRAAVDLVQMAEESGLAHFEGRSYRGWHHHVTLASIAHAASVVRDAGALDCPAALRQVPAQGRWSGRAGRSSGAAGRLRSTRT